MRVYVNNQDQVELKKQKLFAHFLWFSTFRDLSWLAEIKLDEYMGLVLAEVVVFRIG